MLLHIIAETSEFKTQDIRLEYNIVNCYRLEQSVAD
jgi:hypothetical protein